MKITDNYVFFWDGPYSNWYPAQFTLGSRTFNCSEQYMMYGKAMFFEDYDSAKLILATHNPKQQKALGRLIKNFDPERWNKVCKAIVHRGCVAKFEQNEDLKALLLFHGKGRNFVEASPYDKIWGIGMKETDKGVEDSKNWKGLNYLGEVLDGVYTVILKEIYND